MSRILKYRQADVPVNNYGLTIAYRLGILERSLEPFPAAIDVYRKQTAQMNLREGNRGKRL